VKERFGLTNYENHSCGVVVSKRMLDCGNYFGDFFNCQVNEEGYKINIIFALDPIIPVSGTFLYLLFFLYKKIEKSSFVAFTPNYLSYDIGLE
jgi:hypothetical protein